MGIILHILRKDLRRQRWEILLFFGVTVMLAFGISHPDMLIDDLRPNGYTFVLFFALWIFITIRVIQGETLVGDREFWQTRPYRWWQLMVAKTLLLALVLNLPFLLMQAYLISAAGFPLSANQLPGLLWVQLSYAAVLTLPIAALASITESLVQWFIWVFGLALMAVIASWLPWSSLRPTLPASESVATQVGYVIGGALLLAMLFWQYIWRSVWPARIMLLLAAFAIPVLVFIAPSEAMVAISSPLHTSSTQSPLRIVLANASDSAKRHYGRNDNNTWANIRLPIVGTPLVPDAIVSVDGARLTLQNGRGWSWTSDWMKTGQIFDRGDTQSHIDFVIPVEIADRMAEEHPNVKMEYSLKVYRLSSPTRVDTGTRSFSLGNFARCEWPDLSKQTYMQGDDFECKAPLDMPDVVVMRVDSGDVTCVQQHDESPLTAGHHAARYEWKTWNGRASIGLDPILKPRFPQESWWPFIDSIHDPQAHLQSRICPRTPVAIQTGSFVERMRVIADLGDPGQAIFDTEMSFPNFVSSQQP